MTNETTKKQIPSMNLSENVKRSYIEGEDFDPTGITFSVNEVEETLTTTAADLMMAGRVFPQKNLSVETTEIRFTWYGYDMYLPITVKSKNGEKGVPATRDLPLTNSVTAKWYPATGEMATTFTDIVFNKTPLNFALKHVHINNDRLVSCGRSWKLNLHQQVISASKSVLSTIKDNSLEECDYVYVDEYGKQFAFEEKYYFVDDNRNKIYCDKSNVSETDGGILIADIDLSPKQAYREFVSTNGLSLWDKYLGQTSVKILNEKSEQAVSVENQINQLEQAISELDSKIAIAQDNINATVDQNQKEVFENEKAEHESIKAAHQRCLKQLKAQLKQLKLQIPTVYISDTQGVTMCFNENGNLCAIVDNFDNIISIVWENQYLEGAWLDTITGIYENEFYTKINYNQSALITSIITADGKEIKYSYNANNNSKLETVSFPDGKVLNFVYDDTVGVGKYIVSVAESNGDKADILYNNYKPNSIKYWSKKATVSNGSSLSDNYSFVDEIILCNKTLTQMPYIEQDQIRQTIWIDNRGCEIGTFSSSGSSVLDNPLKYNYYNKEGNWGYTVTEEKAVANCFETQTGNGKMLVASLPVSTLKANCKEFVFSATSTTSGDCEEEHVPVFKLSLCQQESTQPSCYCLIAELVDENNQLIETYHASINPQNGIIKATALPITLSDETTTLNLYVQYTVENKTATFSSIRLVPCSWQYTQYNDFGNATKTISSQKAVGFDEQNQPQYFYTETTYTYNPQGRLSEANETVFCNGQEHHQNIAKYQYCNHGNVVREETYVEGKQATDGINVIERVCDERGTVLKEISHNTLDSATKFYREQSVDETGKTLYQTDATGENKTTLVYKDGTTQVKAQVLPNGSTFAYGTDESGNTTSITHSTAVGEENKTNIQFTHGLPTKITSGNTSVEYTYDFKGRVTKVAVNGEETTYQYQEDAVFNNKKCDITTVNSRGVTYKKYEDKQGKVLRTEMDNVVVDSTYDATGKLLTKGNLSYTYDNLDRLVSVQKDGATTETYTYDKLGRVSSKTVDGNMYTYAYKDNISSKVQSLTLPNGAMVQPIVDANGRNTGKELLVDGNKVVAEHISYRKVGDHATNQPSAIYFGDKANGEFAIKGNLKYKYDEMGNVTHIFQDGILVCTYTYDKLSRLIRENNKKLGKTYLYSYDNCGNMLSKRVANHTTKPTEEIEFSEETLYSHVGDKLVSVNGQALSYDSYGRLLTYNGSDLHWEGNRLAGFDGMDIAYDNFGRRIQKYDTTFTYDSNNNLLTAGDLAFFYDTQGIAGFVYEGEDYYYRKNIQGDVIALLTADGTVVASYTYDAWGNCVVATDTNGIGETNPIRYRGYYWDSEFCLYFLQSRYYSPSLCRFISQDSIKYLNPQAINGLNLYAYCSNNPIIFIDPIGHEAYYVVDYRLKEGLPIVGHAVLYYRDEYGVWRRTEFSGKWPWTAKVKNGYNEEWKDAEDITQYFKKWGCDFYKVEVDSEKIKEYAKYHIDNNKNYGGYKFFKNNCLHYVHNAINYTGEDPNERYSLHTIIPALYMTGKNTKFRVMRMMGGILGLIALFLGY